MVEITKKYKIGSRRFGLINWVGAWTLYKKEVLRFLIVWIQTIFSPLISSLLFLLVLSLAIGADRGDILGVPFITFLAPGLISMQVIQQSFSHSSSSFMIGKIQGNILDLLYAPLSAAEVTVSISLAAVTRSVMIAAVSIIVFKLIIKIEITNYLLLVIFTLLSSFILGNIGIIAGLWAEKFDHMATVTNFVIVPLSFLSGTFYSINRLPEILQIISKANPFFYMIDGFRFGFFGQSDVSPYISLAVVFLFFIALSFAAIQMLKSGYKLRN